MICQGLTLLGGKDRTAYKSTNAFLPFLNCLNCTLCNRQPPSLPAHPVYVIQLSGIIIRASPSWVVWWKLLQPPHFFSPKIWVKIIAKLGADLDCSVWVGGWVHESDKNLENFSGQYLRQPSATAHKGQA